MTAQGGGHPWRAMTRVTWIQHRATLVGEAVLVVAIAVAALVTGLGMHASYSRYVGEGCLRTLIGPGCIDQLNALATHTGSLSLLSVTLMVLPVLFGVFIGAPMLAREIEAGTLHFAWTQGIGRTRWLAGKLAATAVALVLSGAVLGAVAAWYLVPFDAVGLASRWQSGQFSTSPLTLPAWSLFGAALGVLIGLLVRRTVEAMAVTAATIGALLVANVLWLHNMLLSVGAKVTPGVPSGTGLGPLNTYATATGIGGPTGSWLVAGSYTGPDGRNLGRDQVNQLLQQAYAHEAGTKDISGYLSQNHITYWLTYQPADRFWIFQAVEALALLAFAFACVAVTLRQARRGPW